MNSSKLRIRQQSEKSFFDSKFRKKGDGDYYSIGFTSTIFQNMFKKLGNIKGEKVLDFGCGQGWLSEILLRKGANVCAFDISEEALRNLKTKKIEKFPPQYQLNLAQMTAEGLAFSPNSFDYVIGNAILHHIDLKACTQEIHRVLKKGGKAYFMEPLGHNPLLNWYRKKTPYLRSPDEKPLLFDDLKNFDKLFNKFNHEEYYLTVLFSLFWYFVFRNDQLILKTRDILTKLDSILLRLFPFLKRYCWYSILVMQK